MSTLKAIGMDVINKIKRQLNYVFLFRAYGLKDLIKWSVILPYNYYCRAGKSAFPLNITMDLTYRCNLKCKVCFLKNILNSTRDELRFQEIKDFIERISKFRPNLFLTGGEPFLRNDILDIIKIIKDKKLYCGIVTNGVFLNKERIEELIKIKLDYIIFSIDGIGNTHDDIRGVPETFNKVVRNLKLICGYRSRPRVIISCLILEANVDKLGGVIVLGKEIGVDGIRFQHLSFLTKQEFELCKEFYSMHFPNEEIKAYFYEREQMNLGFKALEELKTLKRLANEKRVRIIFTPDLTESQIRAWYDKRFDFNGRCIYPWGVARVSPEGDVYPCFAFPIKMGNIKNENFEDIWNKETFQRFRILLKSRGFLPECQRCCKI